MDLIYCDKSFNDVGVLQGYSLDMAYGVDENNFELKTDLDTPKLSEGMYIYYEGTEYGGIIDGIKVNTETQLITYSGRTWYGLLASHIIKPNAGNDYYIASGEAHNEIRKLLVKTMLNETIFECIGTSDDGSQTDTPITLPPYYIRYDDLYSSLFGMLSQANARLKISVVYSSTFRQNMLRISAEPMTSYSAYEEFESELINFAIGRTANKVNHLICLGSGELKNRHVIDLYIDRNGNIEPWLIFPDDTPVEDADYIFDNDYQRFSGKNEIAQVYDYPNAQTIENYTLLTQEPPYWADHYAEYYTKNDSGYHQNERLFETVYLLLTTKPSTFDGMEVYTKAWDSSLQEYVYNKYDGQKVESYTAVNTEPYFWQNDKQTKGSFYWYYTLINGEYVSIEPDIEYIEYDPTPYQAPPDWNQNYMNYYTTDGVSYTPVPALTQTTYLYTQIQPSDWATAWQNYYISYNYDPLYNEMELKYFKGEITDEQLSDFKKQHEFISQTYIIELIDISDYYLAYQAGRKISWEPDTYMVQSTETYPAGFPPKSLTTLYYRREVPPDFNNLKNSTGVYAKEETIQKTWQTNTYYRKVDNVEKIPEWKSGIYYRRTEDHYFDLVQNAVKKLKELLKTDTLDVKLKENDNMYYIGDSILAREKITGLVLTTKITKKIVTVDNGIFNIRYEVS